ncbi:MAG TPA: T9SS type A sorting domain-containing protein [Bacteroidia bacterium]|nr:T9SS type A sorting domain-containing protein [Bacteroidia bacterium]
MKKLLFVLGLAATSCIGLQAQTFFSENFEGAAVDATTGMVAGWHQTSLATDSGWKVGVNTTLQSTYFPIAAHTKFACTNDDACNCNKSNDFLMSPSFSLATATAAFLSVDVYYGAGSYSGSQEVATIEVSTNGGSTWTVVNTLAGAAAWNTVRVDLSAYAGQSNVMLGFRYNDGNGWLFGCCIDNVLVYQPPQLDLSVTTQNLNFYLQKGTAYTVAGSLFNYGAATITNMNLKYSVNGGAAVPTALSSLSIPALTSYNYTSGTPWTPAVSGPATMKIWADSPNGGTDGNHANDTLTATFTVLDSLQQKFPLFEEFNQASCDPCAQATPNLDSVLWNSRNICSAVRYHVNWPGRDMMNRKTQSLFVGSRVTYYAVSGVPDAKLDGAMDVYPGAGGMSSPLIQQEAAIGSPFKINLVATYATSTRTYAVTANIKAFGAIPAGMVARCALTVDTITYHASQTTESIPQTIFPQVAEQMLPGPNGTTLPAFTSGQTQTLNLSWATSHCWGDSISHWGYDSTKSVHFVVWVQNETTKQVIQSANVKATIILGIEELENVTNLNIYPNPNNGDATIAFELKQDEQVKVDIFNSMGQLIRSSNRGNLAAGSHQMNLEGQDLSNGMYFVNITAGGHTVSRKVSIIR